MADVQFDPTTGEAIAPAAPAVDPKATVHVVDKSGSVLAGPGADLAGALAAGARLATDEEVQTARAVAEQEKGTYQRLSEKGYSAPVAALGAFMRPGGAITAFQEGGLAGATGGLAHAAVAEALGAADDKWRTAYTRDLDSIKKAYPGVYAGGEIAGNVARDAILASVGVAPAASLEAGVYSRLGGLAGAGALGRAGARGLSMAVAGGAENAVLGAARELSEEALGDHELNAEKILVAGGREGLMGALFGGALGAGGSLAVSGAKGVARAGVGMLANHADDLKTLANEQRWKALSPAKKFSDQVMARVPGGKDAVGEALGRYGVTGDTIEEALKNGHPEGILPKISAAKEQVGKAIGEIHGASGATMTYGEIQDVFEKHLAPIRKQAGFEGVVGSVEKYQASLGDKLGLTPVVEQYVKANEGKLTEAAINEFVRSRPLAVQDVIFQRKALDALVYQEAKALDPNLRVGLLRDIRRDLEEGIKTSIDTAAKSAGDDMTGEALRKLSKDYQILSISEDAAERSTAAYMTNRNVSLSGQLAGNAAMVMSGSPVTGVAAGFAHQYVKERGNALAAIAFDKLADLGAMARQLQRVDTKLDAAARGLVGGTKALTPYRGEVLAAESKQPLGKRYAHVVDVLAKVAADPDLVNRTVSASSSPNTPKTSSAVALGMTRALAHLAATVTPPPQRQTLGGRDLPARASVEQMTRAVRTFEAITDRERVLDNLSAGIVRSSEVRALRDVSPKMWAELQSRVVEHVAERKAKGKPMKHNELVRLGATFDLVTTPALDPVRMRTLQASFAYEPAKDQQPQGRPRPIHTNTEPQGLDRIEAR